MLHLTNQSVDVATNQMQLKTKTKHWTSMGAKPICGSGSKNITDRTALGKLL